MKTTQIKAILFDVFGTCVDWRSSVMQELDKLNHSKGLNIDCAAFADAWRGLYQPTMEQVRNGSRPWTILDVLHRESLDALVNQFGLDGMTDAELDHLNKVWHRLDPWPDVVRGLTRLKQHFVIAPLSNGNVALLVNMAKRAGLPWDLVLGAEVARCYKPQSEAYLAAARLLDVEPGQCIMVAAHNDDLVAARDCGMHTAFVCRPREHGPGQTSDLRASGDWDIVAGDFGALADQLC